MPPGSRTPRSDSSCYRQQNQLTGEFLSEKGSLMFTAGQYRAKASEYAKLLKTANGPNEVREYQSLERSFTELADDAQWVADNYDKTVHPTEIVRVR
jgi:hypothetical protein